jgi:16S rRNA (guanine527-N7)-methyltransferase
LESCRELLIQGLSALGITPSESLLTSFGFYLAELKKWNRAYNLTSLREDREIIVKHFFDSLLYLKALPSGHLRAADVGSGAGFPGLPLALARPETDIVLIEPSRKKAAFLRHMVRTLGTGNTTVLESRAEQIKDRTFDIVMTRALFSVAELVKRAGHLRARGGIFILSKGPKADAELAAVPEGFDARSIPAVVPTSSLLRHLIVVRPHGEWPPS